MDELGVKPDSRLTNYRLLNPLIEQKLVEQTEGGFRLTASGLAFKTLRN